MPVETTLVKTSLSLKYKDGIDQQGYDTFKVKKFSNVKVNAANQNIFDVAEAFSPLMNYPVVDVMRSDDNLILNA